MIISGVIEKEDGSVEATMNLRPEELQVILQFGVNALVAGGLARVVETQDAEDQFELDFGETTIQ